ncbi:hypothetical protein [Bacillus piscicola]|uniref:hypothetical protein n=1 Tax=Bacillus piscicola TaxID=1632684 RepID=UPI001F09E755|nr:hypothetical protein [Bacillus piscicola]
MKSKMSFFNKGIQKQNIKQHGWISVIYLVGLLFALPLQMLLIASDKQREYHKPVENLFSFGFPVQIIFIVGVPILAGIILFRYLQMKPAVDMIHSLPIRRGSLFANHMISGLVMLLLPLLITALTAMMVVNSTPLFDYLSAVDIWSWLGVVSVMTVFLFSFSVFVGMMTGMSVAQGILTFILLVLPPALFFLVTENLSMFLYGFSQRYYSSEMITSWSPIMWLAELEYKELAAREVIIYLVLAVLVIFIGWALYRFRSVETASQAITFPALRPIFKYGVAFCTMLVSASYFQIYDSTGWLIFGYVAGSLIGYTVAEIILQKTWRIRGRAWLGYGVFAVFIVFIGIIIKTDIAGYETRVPAVDQIEGVYFGPDTYALTQDSETKAEFVNKQAYVEKVRALHEEIVAEQPETIQNVRYPYQFNEIAIAYELENGSRLVREYRLPHESTINDNKLASVLESEPYKKMMYELDALTKPVDKIVFTPHAPIPKSLTITDEEEIKEIKSILQYEIASLKMEEMKSHRADWGQIILETDDIEMERKEYREGPSIPWHKSFQELEKWLKDKNYLDQARVVPDEIAHIEVRYVSKTNGRVDFPDQVFWEDMGKSVKFEDTKIIEKALNHYQEFGEGEYYVKFVTNNRAEFYGILPVNNIPEEIIDKLE